MKNNVRKIFATVSILILAVLSMTGCGKKAPEFSDEIMFSLRIYQPWIYESLHYTLLCDGTLIVQYYETELGRETISDERMDEIKKKFSAEKVYNMNVGKEADFTDGTRRYIVLYDSDGNEIEIGGYEVSSRKFQSLFYDLYALCEDDYTKQFSDLLLECMREGVTYREKYMNNNVSDEPEETEPEEETWEEMECEYINSFKCGYLSQNNAPGAYVMYLIETDEEADYAEEKLGMREPDDPDELWSFNTDVSDVFQEMRMNYSTAIYNYLIYYMEYSQGGNYSHADAVITNGREISFNYDVVESPEGDFGTAVMDGDIVFAAVPKYCFKDLELTNTVSPLEE